MKFERGLVKACEENVLTVATEAYREVSEWVKTNTCLATKKKSNIEIQLDFISNACLISNNTSTKLKYHIVQHKRTEI
jgi:hypothetical protein